MHPHLLIVDDHDAILISLKYGLESYFQVFTCGEAEMSLELLNRFPMDLALVDYKLQETNGLELAKRMLQVRPGLPIVLFSSLFPEDVIQQAAAAGIRACLDKPFDLGDLAMQLRAIIEKGDVH